MMLDYEPNRNLRSTLENTIYLDLPRGRVTIKMRPDLAPRHVERIKQLTREGFYTGAPFWRVIDGFMAQTGDPTGSGFGGSGVNLAAEFSGVRHLRGTVSMARGDNPDSADSQFFIVFAEAPWLDNQYTVWGEVIEGMEVVDALARGDASDKGVVQNPDRIVRMSVAADVVGN
ncbi:MAG: peptidylprolyl isomerase [Alphaproteobacteria bacterium]|nr:peptidylprolyl isomerase [Alphaproteobacteria bacterium]